MSHTHTHTARHTHILETPLSPQTSRLSKSQGSVASKFRHGSPCCCLPPSLCLCSNYCDISAVNPAGFPLFQQDAEAHPEVRHRRSGGQRDHVEDHQRRREEGRGDALSQAGGVATHYHSHLDSRWSRHTLSQSPGRQVDTSQLTLSQSPGGQ